MREPRFTIVTPSFNHARFLERTIKSVLEQDYPCVEHFVIDGGSTDGSVDILKAYSSKLAGWVSERDQGQADAIAKGFRRGTGDLMAWINSSDAYEPGAFRRVADAYRRSSAALYYGDVTVIDEAGEWLGVECTDHLDWEAMVYEGVFPLQPGTFWTREAYERCGGVDPSLHFYMDLDLFVRLSRVGRLCYVPGVMARHNRHSDAKTQRDPGAWYAERERILRRSVPPGGLPKARRVASFLKRLARFAAERRWSEVRMMMRKVRYRGASGR